MFRGPVEGFFVALCQLVVMYWFASFVLLHHSVEVCVDVDCPDRCGWHDVVNTLECIFAKKSHGKVDFAVVIVPVKDDFNVFFPCGVYGNIVVSFESDDEMNWVIL